MDKVICDICGTSYPVTADQCPICGYGRPQPQEEVPLEDEFVYEEPVPVEKKKKVKGGRFSAANVRKRNKKVNTYQVTPAGDEEEEPQKEEEVKESSAVLVVLLLIVIIALLVVTGYIFVQFVLPNIGYVPEETNDAIVEQVEQTSESTSEETTEPTIPCDNLELHSDASAELVGIGQYYLVNVTASPEDTTDEIVYASSDETVAVIDGEGRVEVVGEGTVTITVTCGEQVVECTFTCLAEEPTEETSEETTEEPTEETTEETTEALLDIELFLNKSDFTLSYRGQTYQLKFNSELTAEDIIWTSSNTNVATVENGLVKAVGRGKSTITAQYGDQEVTCVVRCSWDS